MDTKRWINQAQPQTLVIATFLLYFSAVFTLIFFNERGFYYVTLCGDSFSCGLTPLVDLARFVIPVIAVAAGWGIANEHGWAWPLGLVAGGLPLAVRLIAAFRLQASPLQFDVLGLLFEVALVALLLHPQSREYQRIWFTGGGQRRRR